MVTAHAEILPKPTIMVLFWMIVVLFERNAPRVAALANLPKTTAGALNQLKQKNK